MNEEKCIYVYADWMENGPFLIGTLYVAVNRNKEIFSFEYSTQWIKRNLESNEPTILIDPDLPLARGRQYISGEKIIFGAFSDSCPDRWGRLLMKRREANRAKKEIRKPRNLHESDFLLGVYDETRMGALRYKLSESGDFLASEKELATPPWTTLRSLEAASLNFESSSEADEEKWLNQLLAPGSSLGGARPKATVQAPDGSLWIAKFPAKKDEWNIGAWEMVAHELAVSCGLNVPEAQLKNFSKNGSTYLCKRFDRNKGHRIHFASAMTLLGKTDGRGSEGASYLDIVDFITANGAQPKEDLEELWKRIVFSMAISNNDDHLRNHGFILSQKGWVLSPMYDVNPNIYGENLSLDVRGGDSSIDFNLALEVCDCFGLGYDDAMKSIDEIKNTVESSWRDVAQAQGLNRSEIEHMAPAFDMRFK